MQTTILDPSGNEMVILGGPHSYKTFVHGDVTVELAWVNEEPHMLLYRSNPGPKEGCYKIDLQDAHNYADSRSGGPSPTLFNDCIEAAAAMGFNRYDKFAVHKVMTCILDHLSDLVAMPPEPKASQLANRPVSDGDSIEIKVNDKVIGEFQA